MGNVRSIAAIFILLLLPIGIFQNCADFMTPLHDADGSGGLSSSSYNEAGFETTLKPLLATNCSVCHGTTQEPRFAVSNTSESIETLVSRGIVDLATPANSYMVAKISGGHSGLPTTLGAQLQAAITQWSAGITQE